MEFQWKTCLLEVSSGSQGVSNLDSYPVEFMEFYGILMEFYGILFFSSGIPIFQGNSMEFYFFPVEFLFGDFGLIGINSAILE